MRSCSSIITIASTAASSRARSSAETIRYSPTSRRTPAIRSFRGGGCGKRHFGSRSPTVTIAFASHRGTSMAKPQRILVVIDPTANAQPALERAVWLAKRLPAQLELLINDYDPVLSQAGTHARGLNAEAAAKARAARLDSQLARLRALAAPLQASGLDVSVDARWDHPLDEAIVRKATESRADIVIKDTHYHSALKRSLFTNTDWGLIRNCPARLLLVKAH